MVTLSLFSSGELDASKFLKKSKKWDSGGLTLQLKSDIEPSLPLSFYSLKAPESSPRSFHLVGN